MPSKKRNNKINIFIDINMHTHTYISKWTHSKENDLKSHINLDIQHNIEPALSTPTVFQMSQLSCPSAASLFSERRGKVTSIHLKCFSKQCAIIKISLIYLKKMFGNKCHAVIALPIKKTGNSKENLWTLFPNIKNNRKF